MTMIEPRRLSKRRRKSAKEKPYEERENEKRSDPTSILSDDILIGILDHLPDARSVVQCVSVCRRWYSLVNANKQFLRSFRASIFFRLTRGPGPAHALLPEKPVGPYIPDFLPEWESTEIRASSASGLLLVSRRLQDFYVCDPLTRSWTRLPCIPSLFHASGFGLVSAPGENRNNFVAVILTASFVNREAFYLDVLTFSSEAGEWYGPIGHYIEKKFPSRHEYLRNTVDPVASSDGFLHWLDGTDSGFRGVVSFNPFDSECYFIDFPGDESGITKLSRPSSNKVQLGAVGGRVRLSRIVRVNGSSSCLRVWELIQKRWSLVHQAVMIKPFASGFVLAMHPANSDVVFVVSGGEIFRFNVVCGEYEKVGQLPPNEAGREKLGSYMKVFPLVHSLYPSQFFVEY